MAENELAGFFEANYVIVHELLHFDVPNHGKLWKSLMRAHVGDWEYCERLLRERASGRDAEVATGGSTRIG